MIFTTVHVARVPFRRLRLEHLGVSCPAILRMLFIEVQIHHVLNFFMAGRGCV